ncbi:hypothetical protein [Mucilaginibacter sp. BT774]|uniref:hypothetical protein n=1 Tax=Mucilaginibacter sp. BT774 TaxID=3062276 RepID=UPI002676B37B|nr:hypothetical protein [Mucilaginibacter sp. BT774]MDO3626141.1 hypothetical protein [Mucilaginibacter sp. BT774]
MSEYLDPEDEVRDKNKTVKSNNLAGNKKSGASFEKDGPAKDLEKKVLKKDGSLADLPYNNQPGGGALEGTVGIGT